MKERMGIYQSVGLVVFLLAAAAVFFLWTPDKPLTQLEAKYLRAPSDLKQVLGVRFHVRDSGPCDAPAVLMLHGFGSSLHTWEQWADDYSATRSMAVMLDLLEQLGIPKLAVIGNSIGGRIAWTLAAKHTLRVNALVLVSPARNQKCLLCWA